MIVIVIFSILLTLIVSHVYFKLKKNYDLINKIPGPPALPLIGNLPLFNVSMDEIWNVLREIGKTYYPITRIWFGPFPTVNIYHPDDLEILLSSKVHIEKGPSYRVLRPWLKSGILTSSGEKWHQRRKILTPAFHFKILNKYLDITNKIGISFLEALRNDDRETIQDVLPFCTNYTLNIICESAMGVALDQVNDNHVKEYKSAIFEIGNIIVYKAVRPYIQDWMLTPLIKLGRMQKKTLGTLHAFTDKVLQERQEYHRRTGYKYLRDIDNDEIDFDNSGIGCKKNLAMLDLLLKAEKDGLINREGIKEELDTFMFAGHDTTAMTLVYTLILLAEHVEIQEKARSEVLSVLDKSKTVIGMSEVQELAYLERCIKESLRLYPPVPALSRRLKEDLVIQGYVVPAGTEVAAHFVDLHTNPEFWPEPKKFDPDRFLPERALKRHPFSYIPFSAGPRNCIGQKFALMEVKCILARILCNFELQTVTKRSEIKLTMDLVVRPSAPVYIKFVRLDNNN